jgi:hypothetical protein
MKHNKFFMAGMLVVLLALVFIFIGCDTGNGNEDTYVIGDTGPAGGTVFYDKGSYSDGWRYMEAIPDVPQFYDPDEGPFWCTNWYPYSSSHQNESIGGTSTVIGSGKRNTEIIVAYFSSVGDSGADQDGRISAAKLCDDLDYGGKDDWFLPSKDELNQMYLNLAEYPAVWSNGFWSSSQVNSDDAWAQGFTTGEQWEIFKAGELGVRAVRYF